MIESCDYVIMMVHPEDNPDPLAGIVLLIPYPSKGLRVVEVWEHTGDARDTQQRCHPGRLLRS